MILRRTTSLLLLLLCVLFPCFGSAQQRVVRILAIGNSFSQDAIEQNLHELADAEQIPTVIGNMYIGGCSLELHAHNARENKPAYAYRKIGVDGHKTERKGVTLREAFTDEAWDFVSLQQSSPFSGQYETYMASMPELIAYVLSLVPPSTALVLHQTWAYAPDSTHKGFAAYGNAQLTMYRAITNAVRKVSRKTGIGTVVPAGTAIQNARTTSLGDDLTRDGYHLHLLTGRYIAACTWFEVLFGRSVVGNPYRPQGLTEEQQRLAQQSAHAAVLRPWRITQIGEQAF